MFFQNVLQNRIQGRDTKRKEPQPLYLGLTF